MKKKYVDVLKESLIDFDKIGKHTSTVDDIVNFKGKGSLPTHKKQSNVVSVLEDMYYREDNDLPYVSEGEETEVASGTGPTSKVLPDTEKQDLATIATKADGVALPSPQDKKEFTDAIVDAKKDDKTVATESNEMAEDLGESVDEMFEESDDTLDSEPTQENLEVEPDHEAMGDAGNGRDEKIGEDGAALNDDPSVGDADLMEEGCEDDEDLASDPDEDSDIEPASDEEVSEPQPEEEAVELPESEEPVADEPSEDEVEEAGDEDLAELPPGDEEQPVGDEEQPQEEPEQEEAPVLDVDKDTEIEESIIARESAENSIVKRLIREMKLEESVSETDELELDSIDED